MIPAFRADRAARSDSGVDDIDRQSIRDSGPSDQTDGIAARLRIGGYLDSEHHQIYGCFRLYRSVVRRLGFNSIYCDLKRSIVQDNRPSAS